MSAESGNLTLSILRDTPQGRVVSHGNSVTAWQADNCVLILIVPYICRTRAYGIADNLLVSVGVKGICYASGSEHAIPNLICFVVNGGRTLVACE